MSQRVAVISVAPIAMQPVADAFARLWPQAERADLLDEALFKDRGKTEHLTKPLFNRIVRLADYARDSGAGAILFTCSAFGEAIEEVQRTYAMPVLKPNEAMFEAALDSGSRIGMLATAPFAVAQLESEFRAMAAQRKSKATLETVLVAGAMEALTRGDAETHNQLISAEADRLADCDAVILAHFSTSRAAPLVAEKIACPILTAPGAAVLKMKAALSG